METDFKIKAGEFEGPLELLLELIEKHKFHINDLSLSQVADEFIRYTEEFEEFPLSDSADFILIASTLLLIKSRSLLPNLELSVEEEVSIKELEKRLALLEVFRQASILVSEVFGREPMYFALERRSIKSIFAPTHEITLPSIHQSILLALENIPKVDKLAEVTIRKVMSLEETINNLSKRVEESISMNFQDFSRLGKEDKITVIVSFLAMLELVKRGIVRVSQANHFNDILIESEGISVPKY